MCFIRGFAAKPGSVNRNHQIFVRNTGLSGSDHGEHVIQMACAKCGEVYGTDTSLTATTRCPACQGELWTLEYR